MFPHEDGRVSAMKTGVSSENEGGVRLEPMLEFAERDRLVKDAGDTNGGSWGYKHIGKYT